MSGLPRDVRSLVTKLLDEAAAEEILGDLEEIGRERFEGRGWAWGAWVRFEAARSLSAMLADRIARVGHSIRVGSHSLGLDGRAALRGLGRRRDLLATVLLSVALGIGAATVAFSLYDAVLLSALPYRDPEGLVRLLTRSGIGAEAMETSAPLVEALDELPALDASAVGRVRMVVPGESGAERLRGEAVGDGYLDLLGVAPILGRLPSTTSYGFSPGAEVAISEGLWVRRYGADAGVLGRTIRSTDATYSVVGVMPETFVGTTEEDVVDFWVPLPAWVAGEAGGRRELLEDPDQRWLRAVGRLAPGTELASARAALDVAEAELRAFDPELRAGLEPLGERWRRAARPSLLLLVGGALCMLILATLNVTAMILTRLLERRSELATRRALGAARGHLLRSLLMESLSLSAVGAIVGVAAAWAGLDVVSNLFLAGLGDYITLPAHLQPVLNGQALVLAAGLTVAAGAASGVLPSLLFRQGDWFSPADVVRSTRGGGGTLPGRVLAASQVAVATVLVLGAALMLRSLDALHTADPGFRTEALLKLQVTASGAAYPDEAQQQGYVERVLEAVQSHPGVERTAAVAPAMPPLSLWTVSVAAPGAGDDRPLRAAYHAVSDGFFAVLDIPIVAGRPLHEGGTAEGGTVMVSRALAERIAGGATAIVGAPLVLDPGQERTERVTVVGVVEDVLYEGPMAPGARMDLYLPLEDRPSLFFGVAAHTPSGEALAAAPEVRRRVGGIDPTAAVHWVESMEQSMAGQRAGPGRRTSVLALLSALALAIAALGLYGVLAYGAAQRSREYALRMALGASGERVAMRVAHDGLLIVAMGLAVGIPGGLLFGRVLRGLLYGVGPADLASAATAVLVLALTGITAAAVPALRARRVDLAGLLRGEG